jgi:hypothetical protein
LVGVFGTVEEILLKSSSSKFERCGVALGAAFAKNLARPPVGVGFGGISGEVLKGYDLKKDSIFFYGLYRGY